MYLHIGLSVCLSVGRSELFCAFSLKSDRLTSLPYIILWYATLFDVLSRHFRLYPLNSRLVLSCPVISSLYASFLLTTSCLVIKDYFMTFVVLSWYFKSFMSWYMFCQVIQTLSSDSNVVISFRVISCYFMSFNVISCHFMSFHVFSFHVISCHIMSNHII